MPTPRPPVYVCIWVCVVTSFTGFTTRVYVCAVSSFTTYVCVVSSLTTCVCAVTPSCPSPPFQTQPSQEQAGREFQTHLLFIKPSFPQFSLSPLVPWVQAFPYSSHTRTRSCWSFRLGRLAVPRLHGKYVTGHDSDDEIGNFESEFPELEEP
jgi:hypothetical protein